MTVITATATGMVYQLPIPRSGLQKTVIVDWKGDTGDVVLANVSSGTVFNGSTANVITVSSSQQNVTITLTGISTSQWVASIGYNHVQSTGTTYPVSFDASTVTS